MSRFTLNHNNNAYICNLLIQLFYDTNLLIFINIIKWTKISFDEIFLTPFCMCLKEEYYKQKKKSTTTIVISTPYC